MGSRVDGVRGHATIPDPPPVTATILLFTENPSDMFLYVKTQDDGQIRGLSNENERISLYQPVCLTATIGNNVEGEKPGKIEAGPHGIPRVA